MKKYFCNCGHSYETDTIPGSNDGCGSCNAYLHSCMNCRLFNARNKNCTDPVGEPGRMPEGKNYCQHFMPFDTSGSERTGSDRSEKARRTLEGLFGD